MGERLATIRKSEKTFTGGRMSNIKDNGIDSDEDSILLNIPEEESEDLTETIHDDDDDDDLSYIMSLKSDRTPPGKRENFESNKEKSVVLLEGLRLPVRSQSAEYHRDKSLVFTEGLRRPVRRVSAESNKEKSIVSIEGPRQPVRRTSAESNKEKPIVSIEGLRQPVRRASAESNKEKSTVFIEGLKQPVRRASVESKRSSILGDSSGHQSSEHSSNRRESTDSMPSLSSINEKSLMTSGQYPLSASYSGSASSFAYSEPSSPIQFEPEPTIKIDCSGRACRNLFLSNLEGHRKEILSPPRLSPSRQSARSLDRWFHGSFQNDAAVPRLPRVRSMDDFL